MAVLLSPHGAAIRLVAVGLCMASLSGCIDHKACEACIDDQLSLRQELILEGIEAEESLQTREYYRQACATRPIAPMRPCAPQYWPFYLLGGCLSLLGLIVSLWSFFR